MQQQLELIRQQAMVALDEATTPAALEELRVKLLGKKGELTSVLKQMGQLSPEERPVMGQIANSVRAAIEEKLEQRKAAINAAVLEEKLASEKIDVSVGTPQYFISNPEQYKLELVNSASYSAAQRAKTAAAHSGSALGPLMEARQGVIQITAPASSDTSDEGMYDTRSVQKVIRMVMTMKFSLK